MDPLASHQTEGKVGRYLVYLTLYASMDIGDRLLDNLKRGWGVMMALMKLHVETTLPWASNTCRDSRCPTSAPRNT